MGEQMRLKDAPVGAVLRDPDGDLWTRTLVGATVATIGADDVVRLTEWREDLLIEAEEHFGPFVMIDRAPGSAAA